MTNKNSIFKLHGTVQHYPWGGSEFIAGLLEKENIANEPYAEYWMGAHDNSPAVLAGTGPLNEYIRKNPWVLGAEVKKRFGRLPYLLKILDVKDMLSIQLHPTKKSAEIEFEKENARGIPLNAANRNYKDDNHKPELMLALGDFWLLHGFRSPTDLRKIMKEVTELTFLLPIFETGGYKDLYELVMTMEQSRVNAYLQPLLNRITPLYQSNRLSKDSPDFWVARAAITYNRDNNIDKGIFSVYLLNLVHLNKGESIFQDAGILHAYLEGQNVEIMANSDNVLRGGLTQKHIDVAELMKHVIFEPVVPNIIQGKSINQFEQAFLTPAPDFELSCIQLNAGQSYRTKANTLDIFFVLSGSVQAEDGQSKHLFHKGEAFAIPSGTSFNLQSPSGVLLYRASAGIS
jgi:mannose-6-phosphate isomerase